MEKDKRIDYIRDHVKDDILMMYWAEECVELSKTILELCMEIHKGPDKANASKIARLIDEIQEEITDVNLCAEVIDITASPGIRDYKLELIQEEIELWAENASKTATTSDAG